MISVCMATHNGAKYIKEQLDSILQQLNNDDEIIISDDGSTDNTLEIINMYNDQRIKVVNLYTDKSFYRVPELIGRNFENAIMFAKGEYIFISDQDDIWLPNKVSEMLKYLKYNSVVVSNAWLYNNENKAISRILYYRSPLKNYLLLRNTNKKYFGCCLAFQRDMLKYLLPFPKRMPLYDTWIGLVSELLGKAYFLDQPLIYHRIHSSNSSKSVKNPLHYKISYRIRLLYNIYCRVIASKLGIV